MPPVYPPIPRPHLTYKEVDKLDNPVSGTRDDEDDDPVDDWSDLDAPIPPRQSPKVTSEMATEMAVLKEGGDTVSEIAEVVRMDPRTVRKALANVSEDEKQAIATYHNFLLGSRHFRVADKALKALEERDFNEQDSKGRFVNGIVALDTVAGISSDHVEKRYNAAGVGQDGTGARGNPISDFLLTTERANRAIRSLPAGSRLKLHQSVEIVSGEDVSEPSAGGVEADWSESD